MIDSDDDVVYRAPVSNLRPVRGSAIKAGPSARRRLRTVLVGSAISSGAASLGVTGPDPAKLSAEEARRCFGVEQAAS